MRKTCASTPRGSTREYVFCCFHELLIIPHPVAVNGLTITKGANSAAMPD